MGFQIAFYIHHHGSGHIMRALAIASELTMPVTFLGSGLRAYRQLIPAHITCVHLPLDVKGDKDRYFRSGHAVDTFHYAPLNVAGIRERNRIMTKFFSSAFPLLLVVDVSVEVALLARLCSVPTIIMRQHGYRNDPAHLAAYQSACLLIAPYARGLQGYGPAWVDAKTFFSGGFSRYTGKVLSKTSKRSRHVAVMTGKGGTSITIDFIKHLAGNCPDFHFYSIGGQGKMTDDLPSNITFCGDLNDPADVLITSSLIIGNAGHNTVMEVADLNLPFICIPENRPFGEQLLKAKSLSDRYNVKIVLPENILKTDWHSLLNIALTDQTEWQGMINPQALSGINVEIEKLGAILFPENGLTL